MSVCTLELPSPNDASLCVVYILASHYCDFFYLVEVIKQGKLKFEQKHYWFNIRHMDILRQISPVCLKGMFIIKNSVSSKVCNKQNLYWFFLAVQYTLVNILIFLEMGKLEIN